MVVQPQRFATRSTRRLPRGEDICQVLAASIGGADAGEAVKRHVSRQADQLIIDQFQINLNNFKRILVAGVGKASVPMTEAMIGLLQERMAAGFVITKDGYLDRKTSIHTPKLKIIEAGHPVPDRRNIAAGKKLLSTAGHCSQDDLVILLLSGGGSSLLMSPAAGSTLGDIRSLTALLLSCGASIGEINTIRKHIDDYKGGGLAKMLAPATVVTLMLSDVLGDRMDMIASGPTVADPTTFGEAWEILKKYQIDSQVPAQIKAHILSGMDGTIPETLKPGDPSLERVTNIIVGNNMDALTSGDMAARALGFNTRMLNTRLHGEAAQVGHDLAEEVIALLSGVNTITRPACLLAGGETTVTIKGNGTGGRNQELALGAVIKLAGSNQIVLASLATDGGDGPTDAAGAVATNETYAYGMALGLDPLEYLQRNDSYHYFEQVDDLIKTGPTLTNVNDLVVIFGL